VRAAKTNWKLALLSCLLTFGKSSRWFKANQPLIRFKPAAGFVRTSGWFFPNQRLVFSEPAAALLWALRMQGPQSKTKACL
jgi:hypothetical protein